MQKLINIALLCILLAMNAACTSSPNSEAPQDDKAHSAGWLTEHAVEAASSLTSCQTCHGEDFSGGSVGVSCLDCHLSATPFSVHPDSWTNVVTDHSETGAETEDCIGCHGDDYSGGAVEQSCFDCHDSGPPFTAHPDLWTDVVSDHREAEGETESCTGCHGDDYTGGISGKSCFACHDSSSPFTGHPEAWADVVSDHGQAAGDTDVCTGCHGEDYSGGIAGQSCFECHESGPPFTTHSPAWTDVASDHGQAVDDTETCTGCHGDDYSGGVAEQSCFACHMEGPPFAIHPGSWTNLIADHQQEADNTDACKGCHGEDFTGGVAGVSCLTCHLTAPPFTIHPIDWTDPAADHRPFALSYSWTSCATDVCHGADLRGGEVQGVFTGRSCFTALGCHLDGPPAPQTAQYEHTVFYTDPANHGDDAKAGQVYCRNCHGRPENTFDGGFVSDAGILGNSNGNCSSGGCHPAATAHPTNWQGTNNIGYSHWGVSTTTRTNSCALCHNIGSADPSPMPEAPSCYSAGFANADNPGVALSCHASGPPGHDVESFAWGGSCDNCHNDGGQGIVSGVHDSCTLCHVSETDSDRKAGANGDATLADALADPLAATCVTCHAPAVFPTDGFHHLLPDFVSRDCANCHGMSVAHNIGFDPFTDISNTLACDTCHAGQLENWNNILATHDAYNDNGVLVCDTCHKSGRQTSAGGAYNENRTIEDVIFTAMNSGGTVNCLDCHLDRQDVHFDHDSPSFSFGVAGCGAAGCHDADFYGTADTPEVVADVHGGTCTLCHASAAATRDNERVGAGGDGDATLADGTAAADNWTAVNCATCHPTDIYPEPDVHHDHAEYDAGNCTYCHSSSPGHLEDFDATTGDCDTCHNQDLYGTAGVPDVVSDIHGDQCTLCHASNDADRNNEIVGVNGDGNATLADGTAAAGTWNSVTCQTCHPDATYPSPDMHHDHEQAVAENCTHCHDPIPGHGGDFDAESDGCDDCHNQAMYGSAGVPDVVSDIHGNTCTICHASNIGSDDNEKVGANNDGDATLADGTAAAGTWAAVTCLTCHDVSDPDVTAVSIADIHHDNTSAGDGPTQAVAGNCTFCHSDPRPDIDGSGTYAAAAGTAVLACNECHAGGKDNVNGTIYRATYSYGTADGATNNSCGTYATMVTSVALDGAGGTVDHKIASGVIQNYGACLGCHLVGYGSATRKIGLFHARPVNWFDEQEAGAGSNDATNNQFCVYRGAPGRGTFNVFGNAANPQPLGNLRSQSKSQLCDTGTGKVYENCTDQSAGDNYYSSFRGDWDAPAADYGNTMTVPCGAHFDPAQDWCNGADDSRVPHF